MFDVLPSPVSNWAYTRDEQLGPEPQSLACVMAFDDRSDKGTSHRTRVTTLFVADGIQKTLMRANAILKSKSRLDREIPLTRSIAHFRAGCDHLGPLADEQPPRTNFSS